jgi:surface protein
MSLNNNQDSVIFELEYKATKGRYIKLFGSDFINKNKDKCKIMYNENEYDLIEVFKFDNNYNHNSNKIQLRINNNITDISYMFSRCKELLSIRDLSDENFNITDINKSFDGNNFNNYSEKSNNSNEIDKSETFYNDNLILSSIQKNTNSSAYNEINELNYFKENIFTNVTDMRYMFYGCSSLISLPDLSKWNTKNVINMEEMYSECKSLISFPDIPEENAEKLINVLILNCPIAGCINAIIMPHNTTSKTFY